MFIHTIYVFIILVYYSKFLIFERKFMNSTLECQRKSTNKYHNMRIYVLQWVIFYSKIFFDVGTIIICKLFKK